MKKHLFVLLCSLLAVLNLHAQTGVGYLDTWPKPNSAVRAIVQSGNIVYIGGDFTSVGGQSRNRLAAIDATTGTLTAWNPNASSLVNALVVSGSTVYVGGAFTTIDGQSRSYIASLDAATGSATAWNPNAGGNVFALAISGSTVYAGGGFTTIGGQSRNRLAAIDIATGMPTAWAPNASGAVYALAVSGNTVYAGGPFTNIGGQSRSHIAAIDSATGAPTAWNPNASGFVWALAVSGSTVYAGGFFTSIGGQSRNYLAALDANSGMPTVWNPNPNDNVRALAVSDSTVYAGGDFTSIGGQSRNYVAALDATTGAPSGWDPNVDNNNVWSLAVNDSAVYVGGTFTSMGGNSNRQSFMALVDSTNLPAVSIAASADTVCAGTSVTLTATPTHTHTTTSTYQWTINGTTIAGAISSTYTSNTLSNGDNIVCQMTDGGTQYTSNAVGVMVNALPTATLTASGATSFCTGDSVTLHANTGAGLSYQWKDNNTAINNATSASYTANASGSYSVMVTNSNGCTATSPALPVGVNQLPTASITALGSTTIGIGDSVMLQANAGAGYSYQWYRNNIPLSGDTSQSYAAKTGGNYTVRVTNGGCSQISAAVVVIQSSMGVSFGAEGEETFSFSAFPNPADDKVTVRTNVTVSQSATVQVMTLTGAAVKEVEMKDAQTEIDLSGLAAGVYLLRYKDAEGRTGIIRLVKQ